VTALGAAGVVLAGAAPMALASAGRNADPVIARAVAGGAVQVSLPAPGFGLASQAGRPVSLASLRGKVVLLTFLDPVCAGCLTIAQEMNAARALLGSAGRDVELVAVAAGSTHASGVFIRAFDRKGGFVTTPGWLFLTGTLGRLEQVWTRYERVAPHMMTGMTARSDIIFLIDRAGRIRQEIKDDPGPGTASTRSSFAVLLAGATRQVLALR
jgi:cytochrome oxidase Cu insertion factor (SCO1/SenC/PrrC family)